MIGFFVTLLYFLFGNISGMENCYIEFCNGTNTTHTDVEHYCKSVRNDTYMDDRCCIANETGAIIGLDLTSCQIKHVNISSEKYTDLVIMDLRDNDLKTLTSGDLIGLVNLEYLWVPYWMSCPGGSKAWNTSETNSTYCYLQEDPCEYLNISCTINGLCKRLGPGSAKCTCIPGHYGYKCMNEGKFPGILFGVTLSVTTVILSVVLWFAHGRDAYRKT